MSTTRIRSYSELSQYQTFEERYRYLSLRGAVGAETFGSGRYLNQRFYKSTEWMQVRDYVIVRDNGCDLGIDGWDIHSKLLIHHMNPMTTDQLVHFDPSVLDPEYLITTSHVTHNAIHYGDERQLPRQLVVRRPGDTKLW